MLNVERASCHPSGVCNLGVAPRFVKHLWICVCSDMSRHPAPLCGPYRCTDEYLRLCKKTEKFTPIKCVLSYINIYAHVSVASLHLIQKRTKYKK